MQGYSEWIEEDLHRETPDQHPEYKHLYCVDAGVSGFAARRNSNNGKLVQYDTVEITCMYRPLPYLVLEDDEVESELERYVVRSYDPESEIIEYPTTKPFSFVSGGKESLTKQPGIPTTITKLTYIWKQIPEFEVGVNPISYVMRKYSSSLNSVLFDDRHPAGTIYLDGWGGERTFANATGIPTWDCILTFVLRDNGDGVDVADGTTVGDPDPDWELDWAGHNHLWNNFLSPPRYDYHSDDSSKTGNPYFKKYSDLNQIFKYPS